MGKRHKIRSFYNNIITPMSTEGHSTIDTHAVAAVHLKPLSGKSLEVDHNFGLYTKAGRADKFGIIPNSSVSGSYGVCVSLTNKRWPSILMSSLADKVLREMNMLSGIVGHCARRLCASD